MLRFHSPRQAAIASKVWDSAATLSGLLTPRVYCQRMPSGVSTFFAMTSRFAAVFRLHRFDVICEIHDADANKRRIRSANRRKRADGDPDE